MSDCKLSETTKTTTTTKVINRRLFSADLVAQFPLMKLTMK